MGDVIGMVFLVKGDGRLGPLEPRRGGIHLLLNDVVLLEGFIHLGAPKDHEIVLGLGELIVFLLVTSAGLLAFEAGFWALPCWPRVLRM
jgi:hypothetical protein